MRWRRDSVEEELLLLKRVSANKACSDCRDLRRVRIVVFRELVIFPRPVGCRTVSCKTGSVPWPYPLFDQVVCTVAAGSPAVFCLPFEPYEPPMPRVSVCLDTSTHFFPRIRRSPTRRAPRPSFFHPLPIWERASERTERVESAFSWMRIFFFFGKRRSFLEFQAEEQR